MSSPTRPPEPAGEATALAAGGVIHDLGYRGYQGARRGLGAIAFSLWLTGLKHSFGIGRSGRSKWLPFVLLSLNLVPAAVMVGMVALSGMTLPVGYAEYAVQMQMLVSIFAAAQAPVLFSRDLRHGSLVLYLARPLSAPVLAVTRWLALTAALLLFSWAPILLLFLGSILARFDIADHAARAGKAALAVVLLSALVAGITGLLGAWSTRRGLAVVTSIVVLIIGSGIVAIVQDLAQQQDATRIAQIAGLFSPFTLYSGLAHALDETVGAAAPPDTALGQFGYLAVALAVCAICVLLLVRRFQKAGSR